MPQKSLTLAELEKMLIEDGDRFRLAKLDLSETELRCSNLYLMEVKVAQNKSMDENYLTEIIAELSSFKQRILPERWEKITQKIKETFPYYFS